MHDKIVIAETAGVAIPSTSRGDHHDVVMLPPTSGKMQALASALPLLALQASAEEKDATRRQAEGRARFDSKSEAMRAFFPTCRGKAARRAARELLKEAQHMSRLRKVATAARNSSDID